MLETYPEFCARVFATGNRRHDRRGTPTTEGKGLARPPGALAGLKVIDLTRVLGGPYCTHDPRRTTAPR